MKMHKDIPIKCNIRIILYHRFGEGKSKAHVQVRSPVSGVKVFYDYIS